jgi:antitoxin ParD1/3/4
MGIDFGGRICYQVGMSKVQKISVALTPELNAMVQEAVASGQYATSSEVVREALRGWGQYEKAKAQALAHMRGLIQEGIDSGPGREIDFDEFKAELHAEFERRQNAKPAAA